MKTKLILGGLIVSAGFAHAQVWSPLGGNLFSNPIGTCKIGIGTNTPSHKVHVITTTEAYGVFAKNGGQTTVNGLGGFASGNGLLGSTAYGVVGDGSGASDSRGGSFTSNGGFGVYGYSSGGRGAWLEANDMGAGGITIGSDNYATGTNIVIAVRGNVYGSSNTFPLVGGSFQSLNANTRNIGCQGWAMAGSQFNIGVVGSANATNPTSPPFAFTSTSYYPGTNIGIYGTANLTGPYTSPGTSWAGWFDNDVYINGAGYGSSGMWYTSDRKFKKEITTIQNASAVISQLNPTTYFFNTDNDYGINFVSKKQYGFISQEVEAILPDLVQDVHKPKGIDGAGKEITKEVDYKALNYNGFIALLTKGAQEQQQLVEQQSKAIKDLQQQINDLKAQIGANTTGGSTGAGITTALPAAQLSDKNTIVLNQNVPNPFAESTVISYNIPSDFTKAQLVFTTNNAQVIKTVEITAKGAGSVTVFGNDLSHGMYTYSLIVDGKTMDTKKMIKE